jgi:hypothetical protein
MVEMGEMGFLPFWLIQFADSCQAETAGRAIDLTM